MWDASSCDYWLSEIWMGVGRSGELLRAVAAEDSDLNWKSGLTSFNSSSVSNVIYCYVIVKLNGKADWFGINARMLWALILFLFTSDRNLLSIELSMQVWCFCAHDDFVRFATVLLLIVLKCQIFTINSSFCFFLLLNFNVFMLFPLWRIIYCTNIFIRCPDKTAIPMNYEVQVSLPTSI